MAAMRKLQSVLVTALMMNVGGCAGSTEPGGAAGSSAASGATAPRAGSAGAEDAEAPAGDRRALPRRKLPGALALPRTADGQVGRRRRRRPVQRAFSAARGADADLPAP